MAVRVNATNGNYLYRTSASGLPNPGNGTAYTVTAWVYADQVPGNASESGVISLANDTANTWASIALVHPDGEDPRFVFAFREASVTEMTIAHAGQNVAAQAWYFVAGMFAPSYSPDRAYLGDANSLTDTVLDFWSYADATGNSNSTLNVNPHNLMIGSSEWSEYFNGRVANVRIWQAELTQSEIQAEMVALTAVKTSNLWAEYRFANGALTADSSGNGRDLTAQGSPTFVEDPFGINLKVGPFRFSQAL